MNEKSAVTEVKAETSPASREDTRAPERYVTPMVDIVEGEHGLRVVASMPGADPESVDISVVDDMLTIQGRLETGNGRDNLVREFASASYYRQFRLGARIDQSKIQAEFKLGVLNVNLPFAEAAKPRRIKILAA